MENQEHRSGVTLEVDGDFQGTFELVWNESPHPGGWKEIREIAENGSIAIAFFLILELTEYQIIQLSVIGTGFDYWLGYKKTHKNYDEDNFLNAKLEISGINKGGRGKIAQRIKQKLRQIGLSDNLNIPAFVIVNEFGKPQSVIIQK